MTRKALVTAILVVAMVCGLSLPVWADDPTAPFFHSTPLLTNQARQTLTGYATPASLVEVLRGDQSLGFAVSDELGVFSFDAVLTSGENVFTAHVADAQGYGPLSDPLLIVLDDQAPLPPAWDLIGPIVEATQFFYGSSEPNLMVEISLDGQFAQQISTDQGGRFHTAGLRLGAGWHELIATAIDQAGNRSTSSDALSIYVPAILAEYSQALDRLSQYGILRGYSDGTFRPYNPVTRAEFAALLDRTLSYAERPLVSPGPAPAFSDVTPTHWAAASITRLAAGELLIGFPDGTFHPDDWITGKEVIAAIVRAADLEREAQAAREMLGSAPWYSGYSIVGAQHGLLYSNFSPDEKSLRGEVAASLSALVDFFARKGQTP